MYVRMYVCMYVHVCTCMYMYDTWCVLSILSGKWNYYETPVGY